MIYYHSDDYAFNLDHARRILESYHHGALNSVSILPNSDCMPDAMPLLPADIAVSIHLNFCEGKSLSSKEKIPLLVDERGYFCRSFAQMLRLSFSKHRTVKKQLIRECYAQIQAVCRRLPENYVLRIDSHRHYHMIPAVFEAVYIAAKKTGRKVEYVRIPRDPWKIYLQHPSLLRFSRPVNLIKNMVLSTLYFLNCRLYSEWEEPKRAVFFGMMCAGEMTPARVNALLPYYRDLARDRNMDLELMFHPGILLKGEPFLDDTSVHLPFYLSELRLAEKETLQHINPADR